MIKLPHTEAAWPVSSEVAPRGQESHSNPFKWDLSVSLRADYLSAEHQAAEWVEYALATGGEPFLWPAEAALSYAQLALLDVMAVAALLCVAALGATVGLARLCLGSGAGRRRTATIEKKVA